MPAELSSIILEWAQESEDELPDALYAEQLAERIQSKWGLELREMRELGDELAEAAGDIHPTAPSSAQMRRLHVAIDAWESQVHKSK